MAVGRLEFIDHRAQGHHFDAHAPGVAQGELLNGCAVGHFAKVVLLIGVSAPACAGSMEATNASNVNENRNLDKRMPRSLENCRKESKTENPDKSRAGVADAPKAFAPTRPGRDRSGVSILRKTGAMSPNRNPAPVLYERVLLAAIWEEHPLQARAFNSITRMCDIMTTFCGTRQSQMARREGKMPPQPNKLKLQKRRAYALR